MKVGSIGLDYIIQKKMEYIEKHEYEEGLEGTYKGEKKAYSDIKNDLHMDAHSFVSKYVSVCENIGENSDEDISYKGIIKEIVELINPYMQYCDSITKTNLEEKYMLKQLYEITIDDILQIKRKYIDDNEIFDKDEFYYYESGKKDAYDEMILEENLMENDFFIKFKSIFDANFESIEEKRENDYNAFINNKSANERMIGYDNAIIEILELLRPETADEFV